MKSLALPIAILLSLALHIVAIGTLYSTRLNPPDSLETLVKVTVVETNREEQPQYMAFPKPKTKRQHSNLNTQSPSNSSTNSSSQEFADEVRPEKIASETSLSLPVHNARILLDQPSYPPGSQQRKEEGTVLLELYINSAGTITDVVIKTSSGFAELDAAAVEAAKKAKATPARDASGIEITSKKLIRISFRLSSNP